MRISAAVNRAQQICDALKRIDLHQHLNPSKDDYYPVFVLTMRLEKNDAESIWWPYFQKTFPLDVELPFYSEEDDTECAWKGKTESGRAIVIRTNGSVAQLIDEKPIAQKTSVLGRVGVVTIIANQLTEALEKLKLDFGKITIADLARMYHVLKDVDVFNAKTFEKQLRRLDAGGHVTEDSIMRFENALKLSPGTLYFDAPNLYLPGVYQERKADRKFRRTKSIGILKSTRVVFRNIGALDSGLIDELFERSEFRKEVKFVLKFKKADSENQGVREKFCRDFATSVRKARRHRREAFEIISDAIIRLQKAGVAAWLGSYIVRETIDGEKYQPKAHSIVIYVIAFCELNAVEPDLAVDISSVEMLGPTLEDLRTRQ